VPDYYEVLRHAVERAYNANDRLAIYDRARRAMLARLRAAQPPIPDAVIRSEQAALEDTIRRVESEFGGGEAASSYDPAEAYPPPPDAPDPPQPALRQRRSPLVWIGAAGVLVLLLLVGVGGYAFLSMPGKSPLQVRKTFSSPVEVDDRAPATDPAAASAPPGFVYRRQLVYYRSSHPVGTIIVDKAQRFLYVVRPNVVAVRYGMGVGRECLEAAGLLRISRKQELTGGRDNPLGARVVYLGDDAKLIHGTERADTIGRSVWLGCFRLIDSDVIELYSHVDVGGRVLVN
jgi:lipoprotein-anchoring transpeptidase ErfK/SrfK